MKPSRLIRADIRHDIHAPDTDELNGQWHKGYRLPSSETVAFYHRRAWYASNPFRKTVTGPYANRDDALTERGCPPVPPYDPAVRAAATLLVAALVEAAKESVALDNDCAE